MMPVRDKVYDNIVGRINFTTFYSAATPFDYALIEAIKTMMPKRISPVREIVRKHLLQIYNEI